MTRFRYMVAAAAALALTAATVAAASGGTRPDDRATHGPGVLGPAATIASARPDDRATHGPGVVGAETAIASARPDDRAWRGAGPAPAVAVMEAPTARLDAFDWADAGIGAAMALGLGLLVAGASVLVSRRHRVAALS